MTWTSGDKPPSGQHPAPPCHLPALPSCPLVWRGSSPPSRWPTKLKGNKKQPFLGREKGGPGLEQFPRWQPKQGMVAGAAWPGHQLALAARGYLILYEGHSGPEDGTQGTRGMTPWPRTHLSSSSIPGQWVPGGKSPRSLLICLLEMSCACRLLHLLLPQQKFREHKTQVCYWARVPG